MVYDTDLLKIQVLQSYYDKTYRSKSGKSIRFVAGRFKQIARGGYLMFRGALVIVDDEDSERESIEVFRQPYTIRQIKLRKSRLADLAGSRVEPEKFIDDLVSIIEDNTDISSDEQDSKFEKEIKTIEQF